MTRADFERWMIEDYKCVVGSSDPYPAGIERDMWRCWQAASRDRYHEVCTAREAIHLDRIAKLEESLKPWGSGGIITGTVLAWIAAKDPAVAKAVVYGKAAVDRALNP